MASFCEICGDLIFEMKDHVCGDKYEVEFVESGIMVNVYAKSFLSAAEKACEEDDNIHDYGILNDGGADVLVRKGEEEKKIYVEAYITRDYYAKEKTK